MGDFNSLSAYNMNMYGQSLPYHPSLHHTDQPTYYGTSLGYPGGLSYLPYARGVVQNNPYQSNISAPPIDGKIYPPMHAPDIHVNSINRQISSPWAGSYTGSDPDVVSQNSQIHQNTPLSHSPDVVTHLNSTLNGTDYSPCAFHHGGNNSDNITNNSNAWSSSILDISFNTDHNVTMNSSSMQCTSDMTSSTSPHYRSIGSNDNSYSILESREKNINISTNAQSLDNNHSLIELPTNTTGSDFDTSSHSHSTPNDSTPDHPTNDDKNMLSNMSTFRTPISNVTPTTFENSSPTNSVLGVSTIETPSEKSMSIDLTQSDNDMSSCSNHLSTSAVENGMKQTPETSENHSKQNSTPTTNKKKRVLTKSKRNTNDLKEKQTSKKLNNKHEESKQANDIEEICSKSEFQYLPPSFNRVHQQTPLHTSSANGLSLFTSPPIGFCNIPNQTQTQYFTTNNLNNSFSSPPYSHEHFLSHPQTKNCHAPIHSTPYHATQKPTQQLIQDTHFQTSHDITPVVCSTSPVQQPHLSPTTPNTQGISNPNTQDLKNLQNIDGSVSIKWAQLQTCDGLHPEPTTPVDKYISNEPISNAQQMGSKLADILSKPKYHSKNDACSSNAASTPKSSHEVSKHMSHATHFDNTLGDRCYTGLEIADFANRQRTSPSSETTDDSFRSTSPEKYPELSIDSKNPSACRVSNSKRKHLMGDVVNTKRTYSKILAREKSLATTPLDSKDPGIPVPLPVQYQDHLDPLPGRLNFTKILVKCKGCHTNEQHSKKSDENGNNCGKGDDETGESSASSSYTERELLQELNENEKGSHTCLGCQRPVHDRYVIQVRDHGYWHADCLRCSTCDANLSQQTSCYVKDDRVFCRTDYNVMFGLACVKCSLHFKKDEDWMRVAGQHRYHIACFLCKICKRQLGSNERYHLVNGSDIYCTNHYRDLVNGDSSDGQHPPKKAKRNRTSYTESQIKFLQDRFNIDSNPDGNELEKIASRIGLKKRVVQVWFQNNRARLKKTVNNTKGGNQENKSPSTSNGLTGSGNLTDDMAFEWDHSMEPSLDSQSYTAGMQTPPLHMLGMAPNSPQFLDSAYGMASALNAGQIGVQTANLVPGHNLLQRPSSTNSMNDISVGLASMHQSNIFSAVFSPDQPTHPHERLPLKQYTPWRYWEPLT